MRKMRKVGDERRRRRERKKERKKECLFILFTLNRIAEKEG
jgi:hypothetical protein